MGQGQSQTSNGRSLAEARPGTPDQDMNPEERARLQAEDRERRAAAAQQRVDNMQKKKKPIGAGMGAGGGGGVGGTKKKSALQEMSAENRGWRAADEQADLRAWN